MAKAQPGTLLKLLECKHSPCEHSQLVYKSKKLCENHETCSIRKKFMRQQKVEKPA